MFAREDAARSFCNEKPHNRNPGRSWAIDFFLYSRDTHLKCPTDRWAMDMCGEARPKTRVNGEATASVEDMLLLKHSAHTFSCFKTT